MTGHNRTIVDTYNALSHTSTKFKRLVSRYIKRLPKISANRDMYPGLHSMRQILKQYGRGSGLVMALKETINSPQWINAWINLLFTGVATWMYVTAIFRKKGKNRFSYLYCPRPGTESIRLKCKRLFSTYAKVIFMIYSQSSITGMMAMQTWHSRQFL